MTVNIKKRMKRMVSVLSCTMVAVAGMSVSTWAEAVDELAPSSSMIEEDLNEATGQEIFERLTNPGVPEGYQDKSIDKHHPYGYGDKTTVTLRNSGLMIASSAQRDGSNASKAFSLRKGYTKGGSFLYTDTSQGNWSENRVSGNGDRMNEFAYIQSVSFDPDGDGLRDIIAFIGVDRRADQKYDVSIWTLNSNDAGGFPNNTIDLGKATWIDSFVTKGAYGSANPEAIGRNFFSITAGDYDADGKDTIVAYACLDGNNYGVFEIGYNNGSLSVRSASQALLNPAYTTNPDLYNSTDVIRKLKGDVSTGDLDDDGIDDLVVVSEISKVEDANLQKAREAYLGVSLGVDGGGSPTVKANAATYISDGSVSVTSATTDVGKITSDGYNRLTVSGHMMTKDAAGIYQQVYNEFTKTVTYFYDMKDGALRQVLSRFETTSPYDYQCLYSGDECLRNVPVCSAYVNGYGQQEDLFINGQVFHIAENGEIICRLSGFDSDLERHTQILFDAVPVTVDNNDHGIEQFAISYYGRRASNTSDITAKCALIYGNASYDKEGKLTPCSGYRSDTGRPFDQAGGNGMGSFQYATNMTLAPFENKNSDVMKLRLNEKGYFYSNPEPVAVLQAAPYFKELGSSYAGSTQYSLTASYIKGSGNATSSSIGGGFAETFSAGPLKQTFSLTYKTGMSEDFKTQKKDSFTTSFTATSKDTVVMQNTPVVYYSYDVFDEQTNSWKDNQVGITVAQIPVYTQITVDEYNNFVEYYDQYVQDPKHHVTYTYGGETKTVEAPALYAIDKANYYLGNSGNPAGYSNEWGSLPDGKGVTKGTMELGYQGGSTTNNYGYETSETKTHTKNWSVDASLNVQLGGALSKLVGLWVGGSFSKSQGSSQSTFETTGNGYSIAGTVKNLDIDTMTKSGQFSEDAIKAYKFHWTFGMAEFQSHVIPDYVPGNDAADIHKIPVVCYVVDNVTKGFPSPTLKTLTENINQYLELTWEAPQIDEGEKIEGYNVYCGDIDGKYTKITDTPLEADKTSFEFIPGSKASYYSFVVTAIGKVSDKQEESVESAPSNAKSIIITPGAREAAVGVKDTVLTYGEKLELTKDDLIFPEGVDQKTIDFDKLQWTATYEQGSPAGKYTVSAKGLTSDNYVLTYEAGMITVNPIQLDAKALSAAADDKVYDGTNKASGLVTVDSGLLEGDQVKITYSSAEFEDEKPGTGKTVTFKGLDLTGSKALSYSLEAESITAAAAITKAEVVVWASGGTSHKYDAAPKSIIVSAVPDMNTNVVYYRLDESRIVRERVEKPTVEDNYMYVITLNDDSPYEISKALTKEEKDIIGQPFDTLSASNIGIMSIANNAQPDLYFTESFVEKKYGDENFANKPEGVMEDAVIRYEVAGGAECVSVDAETGEVTILKPGVAMIKATAAADGYDDVSANYVINIEKQSVNVSITVAEDMVDQAGDQTEEPIDQITRIAVTYGERLEFTEENLVFPDGVKRELIHTEKLQWSSTYDQDSPAGLYIVMAEGLESEYYNFIYESANITVYPKILTADNLTAAAFDKIYDGTNKAAGSVEITSGLVGKDVIRVIYDSAEFDNEKPETDKTVTFRGLNLIGANAASYDLKVNSIEASASITKAEVMVWASAGTRHKYDGTAKGITASAMPEMELQVAYYLLNENGIVGNAVAEPADLGNYMYVITLADESTHEIRKALPKKESEFIGHSYESLSASNIGIMSIGKNVQPQMYFAESVVRKTYGDTDFAQQPRGGIEGAQIYYEVVNGEDCVAVESATGKVHILKPGIAEIKATASAVGYEDTTADYIISISKLQIEVQMPDKNRLTAVYGDDLALTADDLVFPDGLDITLIDAGLLQWDSTYEQESPAGRYTISAEGLKSDYFTFLYGSGIITVEPKELTAENLSASAKDKIYDGTTTAKGTITVTSGLVGDDIVRVAYDTAEFEDANAGMDKTVTFTGMDLTGTKAVNYRLTADSITAKASIIKAEAVVWASAGTRQRYDAAPKEITASAMPKCETMTSYYSLDESRIIGSRVENPTDPGSYMYVIRIAEDAPYEISNALPKDESAFIGVSYNTLNVSNIGIMTIDKSTQPEIHFDEPIVKKTYGDAAFIQKPTGTLADAQIHYEVMGNADCVTVNADTGEVKIVKPGEAMIRATVETVGYENVTASYTISVAKKLVAIKLTENYTQIYTGETIDVPYEVSGDVTENKIAKDDIAFTYTNTKNSEDHTHNNIGEYYVTAKIPVTNPYYMTDGEVFAVLTISAKTATIIPKKNQSKMYGQYDPVYKYTVTGLDEGDVLTGELGRTKGEKPGFYKFNLGTLKNDKYQLKLADKAEEFYIQDAPVYSVPNCKLALDGNKLKLTWDKIAGADGYEIYAGYCRSQAMKPIKTVSADKNSLIIKKLNGKTIDQKRCFRVRVDAYKLKKGKKVTYKKSLQVHLPGKDHPKYTGAKSIKIKSDTTVSLKVGQKSRIKATTKLIKKKKQLIDHCEEYRYASTAKYIATVNKKGVITAAGPGVCTIYVYAQNGVSAKVNVVVNE